MNCCRCGRPLIVRTDTPIVQDSHRRRYAWGPRCAVLAGLVKPKRRKTTPPTASRAREFVGQIDWIETTEEGNIK